MNKVIRNEANYEETLSVLENLMDRNPTTGTDESDELELLTLLIQDYESRQYQFVPPNPVEAIKFRMEQQKLTPRDLIPYIGSRSKVSEVLSGKRSLTLSMIRALHSGLGIPASVLIQEQDQDEEVDIDWDRFPIKQMIAWGWITAPEHPGPLRSEEILRPFFAAADSLQPGVVLFRTSKHIRSARSMDDYALKAWSAQVLIRSSANLPVVQYKPGILTLDFLRGLARLSVSDKGPLLAKNHLREHGIQLVVERHLPRTYIDGAVFMVCRLSPIIGLTLRYDRIDNFWFTLMHELAHLALHLDNKTSVFYDDLDMEAEDDPRECEADQLAREALIPYEAWNKSPASHLRSPEAAEHLAKQLQIHPAIIAGRMRHEFKAYRLLNNLVGHRKVRKLFLETKWR
jgi:Predicted transcription regulator containing HTH domain